MDETTEGVGDELAPTEPAPAPQPVDQVLSLVGIESAEALLNAPAQLAPAPQELPPDEWARALGAIPWQHAAAAALHRWAHHAHHAGEPLQLTREDYEAAIAAALEPEPKPHPGALSAITGA